jgi:uncharacterized membrane protein
MHGVSLPDNFQTNFLMALRWIHFLAGITWIGLLYFFNLVGFGLMKELDSATRGKVMPAMMARAMWWFRWSALVTVLAGLAYWGQIVSAEARAAGTGSGTAMAAFFLIWTICWAVLYAMLLPRKKWLESPLMLTTVYIVVVGLAAYLFVRLNSHGWETNSLISIGIGGGIGWLMLLNVWGVVWRIQKRLIIWTKANAENGTPIPEKAQRLAQVSFLTARASAFLTIPMLFFMGASSHYPMFHS